MTFERELNLTDSCCRQDPSVGADPRRPRHPCTSRVLVLPFGPVAFAYRVGVTTREELRDIVAAGEDQAVEFKNVIPPVDQIARHLAAFANTSGGRLLLGMGTPTADDAETPIHGADPDRAVNSIICAAERVEPRPQVKTEVIPVDGRPVVIADVAPSTTVPVMTAGVAYVRKGAFTTPATAGDILGRAVQKAVIQAPAELSREPLRSALRDALRGPTEAIERQSSELQRLRASGSWQRYALWVVIGAVLGAVLGAIAPVLLHLYP